MARVRIEIEYDDAEEDFPEPTGLFSAHGTKGEDGPSLRVTRDDAVVAELEWFKCAHVMPWRRLVVQVALTAACFVAEEMEES